LSSETFINQPISAGKHYCLEHQRAKHRKNKRNLFLNQLSEQRRVKYHDRADFTVNEKYVFEIGGKNKTKSQIQGLENAYIVQDDIAFGVENTIPLWLFGMLY
jgi:hypothetical protein